MSASLQHNGVDTLPWYRQFWPWFVMGLPATAVIASFITLWIAIDAAPDRIDGFGAMAIPVEFSSDRETLIFDLGPPGSDASWPAFLTVTLVSRADGGTQQLQAKRFDEHYYKSAVPKLRAGAHNVMIVDEDSRMSLHGSWAYPAPVWKLRLNE